MKFYRSHFLTDNIQPAHSHSWVDYRDRTDHRLNVGTNVHPDGLRTPGLSTLYCAPYTFCHLTGFKSSPSASLAQQADRTCDIYYSHTVYTYNAIDSLKSLSHGWLNQSQRLWVCVSRQRVCGGVVCVCARVCLTGVGRYYENFMKIIDRC